MPLAGPALHALVALLAPERRTAVVDVGANPIDGDPPYRPLLDAGLVDVVGFEPQPAALARLHELAGPTERYLPHAVGDGRRHTLHVCASDGFTSLLEPDPDQLAVLVDFPRLAAVVEQVEVETTRLDDVADLTALDLLKIDVQGGELAVFEHGRDRLAGAVAVQTEVGYHRLYRDQPLAGDVDAELRSLGLVPQAVVSQRTWPLAPVPWADELEGRARHLVEADLLYVRDPARLDRLDDEQLRHLAIVTVGAYDQVGVAIRCVGELVARGSLGEDAPDRLREVLTG